MTRRAAPGDVWRVVRSFGLAAIAIGVTSMGPLTPGPPDDDLAGNWQGRLQGALKIILHVTASPTGYTATLDSPDQGANGLVVDKVELRGDSLHLELTKLGARWDGRLDRAGRTLDGAWQQSGVTLPLAFKAATGSQDAHRPQEPAKPYPYEEEEVRYSGGGPGITLTGTLTRPRRGGPFPCVMLISGSGPQDRNETVFGHKPFLVIADRLTRSGVAVLRVDDRGVGGSTGGRGDATSEDYAADVRAGLKFLNERNDIDVKRIGLIGHSEGGIIAPMVATKAKEVSFIVLMAGTGVPGDALLEAQGERLLRAMGQSPAVIERQKEMQRRVFDVARAGGTDAAAEQRLREAIRNLEAARGTTDSATVNTALNVSLIAARSRWFRYFIDYDPRPVLRKVKCPVLVMNGELDMQVPADQNLPEIERALKAAGNRGTECVRFAGLNHLFQTSKTGLPSEYATIDETIAPAALDTLAAWIQRHVGQAAVSGSERD